MLSAEDHRKKTDGFSEAFPRHCPGGKVISVIEGHEDEDESFQKTFELLRRVPRSEEHTSELQSHSDLVCRLLLEKKKRYVYEVDRSKIIHSDEFNGVTLA